MNEIERKKRYRQHRFRIQNATSLVESQAPKPKEKDQRELTFIEMMSSLCENGKLRTFTQSPVRHARSALLNELQMQLSSKELAARNNFTSNLSLGQRKKKGNMMVEDKEGKQFSYAVPYHVWQRYKSLPFVKTPHMLGKLLRPQIYLDLKLQHGQPLGRLVVQLFTEACPEIVLQFVRLCLARQAECFRFTRLLRHLWLEGELHLADQKALTIPNIEHDPMAINHGSAAGILSFPSRYLRGSKFRYINFSVSFKAIDVLNGKRIAFGKIRRGQHVLEHLQTVQVTSNGKPQKEVIVTSCGVL